MGVPSTLKALLADCAGATAIEYALMAAVVSITAIGGLQAFAGSMDIMWNVVIVAIADALASMPRTSVVGSPRARASTARPSPVPISMLSRGQAVISWAS